MQLASRAAARQSARIRPSFPLVGIRFNSSSSLQNDRDVLSNILAEVADRQDEQTFFPAGHSQDTWQSQGQRRQFSLNMFIRPHFWSHEHRFKKQRQNLIRPAVAPGRREALEHDVLHYHGIDPLWETSNPSLLSSFVTVMGKIKPRSANRITTKTQRRMGKAIRRARMMGVIPFFSTPKLTSSKKRQRYD
ncbi:hypothetical protein BU15DRAFT_39462 [Melanogaster broomeanus]|nr:hypothetical protein BU15DRAFT_39462 [Melanogaster broomeanus]